MDESDDDLDDKVSADDASASLGASPGASPGFSAPGARDSFFVRLFRSFDLMYWGPFLGSDFAPS